jgi:hypothetical protein
MFGLGTLQVAVIASIIAGLATGAAYLKGRSDGFALGAAKGVTATMDQLEQRGQINEAVRKTGECDLIVELGGVCE